VLPSEQQLIDAEARWVWQRIRLALDFLEVGCFVIDPLLLLQPVQLLDGVVAFAPGEVAVGQFSPELGDLLFDGDSALRLPPLGFLFPMRFRLPENTASAPPGCSGAE
jgi:hypothetical protein